MRSVGRTTTSRRPVEDILADEETHVDYLETQLELLAKLGEELYSAQARFASADDGVKPATERESRV